MAVTTDTPAPYAPASAVLDIINRYRSKGLPVPITGEILGRAGISASLTPRTLHALEVLDLIDEKGVPTSTLVGLQKAAEPDFKQRLTEWLDTAYADVRNFIDPADADETAIRDAFRSYKPVGQQRRMVTLFQGLYAFAGIITDKKVLPARTRPRTVPPPKPRAASSNTQRGDAANPARKLPSLTTTSELPAPLVGLLTSLPVSTGSWTKDDRDKFVTVFGSVIDYCFRIVEPQELDDAGNDE
jgi:hypothetical protein